jgi:hypothetical protein
MTEMSEASFDRSQLSRRERFSNAAWRWIANQVPRNLAYACTVRVAAHASCGCWANEPVENLTFVTMLRRWFQNNY